MLPTPLLLGFGAVMLRKRRRFELHSEFAKKLQKKAQIGWYLPDLTLIFDLLMQIRPVGQERIHPRFVSVFLRDILCSALSQL